VLRAQGFATKWDQLGRWKRLAESGIATHPRAQGLFF
jgi:hypothetical protein